MTREDLKGLSPEQVANRVFPTDDPPKDTYAYEPTKAYGLCPTCKTETIYFAECVLLLYQGTDKNGRHRYEPYDAEPHIAGRFCVTCGTHSDQPDWGQHPGDQLRALAPNTQSGPGPSTYEIGILEARKRKSKPGAYWKKIGVYDVGGTGSYREALERGHYLEWLTGIGFDVSLRHHSPCDPEITKALIEAMATHGEVAA